MRRVELYARVRHAVMIEGLSQREAARRFGIDPRTVKKMLRYSVPPGYVRSWPPVRPKVGKDDPERHCHVWTPPVLQGENRFETAVELAVMYPAFSLRYADRWP